MAILTNLGQLTRNLIRRINRFKLVERSLFAIIDLLQGAKSNFLYFIWRVGGWFKKNQILEEKKFHFVLWNLFF